MKGGSNSEKEMAALGLASRSVVGVSGPASSPSYTSTSPGTGHTETLPTEELADRVGRSMSQGSSTWLNYVSAALVIAVICIHFGLGDRVATIIVGTEINLVERLAVEGDRDAALEADEDLAGEIVAAVIAANMDN